VLLKQMWKFCLHEEVMTHVHYHLVDETYIMAKHETTENFILYGSCQWT
jgi:hypothetical protein